MSPKNVAWSHIFLSISMRSAAIIASIFSNCRHVDVDVVVFYVLCVEKWQMSAADQWRIGGSHETSWDGYRVWGSRHPECR